MTDKRPLDDLELDDLFSAAKSQAVTPSGDLLARIMLDAETQAATHAPIAPAPERQGFIASLLGVIGGWPAAAGLATATVAGVVIGISPPDVLETWSASYLADANIFELEDLLPAYGGLFDEG